MVEYLTSRRLNKSRLLGMKRAGGIIVLFLTAGILSATARAEIRWNVYTDRPVHPISQVMYGLFFEDINFAADGGLYAELIQNRSFEFDEPLFNWATEGDARLDSLQIKSAEPIHKNNPRYLRLTIPQDAGIAGVSNAGYGGIAVTQGTGYLCSVYLRVPERFEGNVFVRLENKTGKILGQSRLGKLSGGWQKYTTRIQAKANEKQARLLLLFKGHGQVDIDMVSLFPENTWKNQDNGLRADLVQMLADLKPAFIRFPGGCIVEGKDLANAYRWKDTIGPVAERKTNWNRWAGWKKPPQYYQSYGLGFFEYFRLCSDLGAEPVPILNCGMSCQYQDAQLVPLDELDEYVQDALDLIEYANGSADTVWGAKRARAGHPAPFNLKYLGVGNEQWGEQYFERYDIFYKAIKAKYPNIQIVTTSGPGSDGKWFDLAWNKFKSDTPAEVVDEHYYRPPQWFLSNSQRYDSYDRKGPKVFAGEYAAHNPERENNLLAALSEAAFITGLERNSDVVIMASYAPLFAKLGSTQWAPDLIWFDNTQVYGTPSYYVQKMFSTNVGTHCLRNELVDAEQDSKVAGRIGLCTWDTAAEFKDIKVVKSGQTLFQLTGSQGWETKSGKWQFKNGMVSQNDSRVQGAVAVVGDPAWSNYTLSLKARKTAGREGFIIMFRRSPLDQGIQWNLGGWGNSKHAIQVTEGPVGRIVAEVPGKIENDRWYNIQIELQESRVRCILDGRVIHALDVPVISLPKVYVSSTYDSNKQQVILKVVNPFEKMAELLINLDGRQEYDKIASVSTLTADNPKAENTINNPRNVCPEQTTLKDAKKQFKYQFEPSSLTIIKLQPKAVAL